MLAFVTVLWVTMGFFLGRADEGSEMLMGASLFWPYMVLAPWSSGPIASQTLQVWLGNECDPMTTVICAIDF